jgi:hypothetical protein
VRDIGEQTHGTLDSLDDTRCRPRVVRGNVAVDCGNVGEGIVDLAELHRA